MQVQIKEFTGPLDLLLQLVRREEMDIFDIDIHKITDQYLHVLSTYPIPDLHTAGDFIKMAATLIYIKSASLFPSESEEGFDENTREDLQSTLIKSLLQIQQLQHTAKVLNQGLLLGRDTWAGKSRTDQGLLPYQTKASPQTFLKLLKAYYGMMNRTPGKKHFRTEETLPVLSDYIRSLQPHLPVGESLKMSSLYNLFPTKKNTYIIMTFLSLLELNRLGVVSLYQRDNFSDIIISVKKILRKDYLSLIGKEPAYRGSKVKELA